MERLPFPNTSVGAGGGSFLRSRCRLSRWGRAVPSGCFFPNSLGRLGSLPPLFEFVCCVLGQFLPGLVHRLGRDFYRGVHHLAGGLVSGGVLFFLVKGRLPEGADRFVFGLEPQPSHSGPREGRFGLHRPGLYAGSFQLDVLQRQTSFYFGAGRAPVLAWSPHRRASSGLVVISWYRRVLRGKLFSNGTMFPAQRMSPQPADTLVM